MEVHSALHSGNGEKKQSDDSKQVLQSDEWLLHRTEVLKALQAVYRKI